MHRLIRVGVVVACAMLSVRPAASQSGATLDGTVVDEGDGSPIVDAVVTIRRLTGINTDSLSPFIRRSTTGRDGVYRFPDLARGRYRVDVERLGYRMRTLEVDVDRSFPLRLSLHLEPVPFPLAAMDPRYALLAGPTLVPPPPGRVRVEPPDRAGAIRARQRRFIASDVRQLSYEDLRESNTLLEDDVMRAFHRVPGVATRDEYAADFWSRGAPSGQTAVLFDGIPLVGGFHALGVIGGLNSDLLRTATFRPGVPGAADEAGAAATLALESRPAPAKDVSATASLSPVSLRTSAGGHLGDRLGWAVGLRRSYLDGVPPMIGLFPDERIPYAFGDVTGRIDLRLSDRTRIEASVFAQADRVFGDVPDIAWGNVGQWGTRVARATLVTVFGSLVLRNTIGLSGFDASVVATRSGGTHAPLHPDTRNHYRSMIWESRLESGPVDASGWSVGVRATTDRHDYDGPGIDLTRLVSPDEFARRGIVELTSIILDIDRASVLQSEAMNRISFWGQHRSWIGEAIEVEGGLRLETGDLFAGSLVRLTPRVRVRYARPGSPLTLTAGWGRVHQYVQAVARTDVIRSGLHVNEVLVQAGEDTPALTTDILTAGAELWRGGDWLLGATGWLRASRDVLIPEATPGLIEGPRDAVPAAGTAYGVEISVRKPNGRVTGFGNYTLSRSGYRAGVRAFDASEDRRHTANIGVTARVLASFLAGATVHAQSGSPYTRVTVVHSDCDPGPTCDGDSPVLYGAPSGQRAPGYASVDLMAEWTHHFDAWALSLYGQIRNALGSANAVTYQSSCVCIAGQDGADASLGDRFDRGLPRLPVLGIRIRFRE